MQGGLVYRGSGVAVINGFAGSAETSVSGRVNDHNLEARSSSDNNNKLSFVIAKAPRRLFFVVPLL